jgi:hypothetical protein
MQNFMEFVDRKQRDTRHRLGLIKDVLERHDLKVKAHLYADDDPYIFVKADNKKVPFEGVRIYHIGDQIAYRVQNLENSEPYGKAYALKLEDMFNDFMSENIPEEEAGKKVMEAVAKELKKFFSRSAKASEEIRTGQKDGVGTIIKTGGTDYSAMVLNRL